MSRRSALGSAALAVFGAAVGGAPRSTAQAASAELTVNDVSDVIHPAVNALTNDPRNADLLPPANSVVRVAISDPTIAYDVAFGSDNKGTIKMVPPDLQKIQPDQSLKDMPVASVQMSAETLRSLFGGTLRIETALASRLVNISGDRKALLPLASVPDRLQRNLKEQATVGAVK